MLGLAPFWSSTQSTIDLECENFRNVLSYALDRNISQFQLALSGISFHPSPKLNYNPTYSVLDVFGHKPQVLPSFCLGFLSLSFCSCPYKLSSFTFELFSPRPSHPLELIFPLFLTPSSFPTCLLFAWSLSISLSLNTIFLFAFLHIHIKKI
jgi:hypothetical protein